MWQALWILFVLAFVGGCEAEAGADPAPVAVAGRVAYVAAGNGGTGGGDAGRSAVAAGSGGAGGAGGSSGSAGSAVAAGSGGAGGSSGSGGRPAPDPSSKIRCVAGDRDMVCADANRAHEVMMWRLPDSPNTYGCHVEAEAPVCPVGNVCEIVTADGRLLGGYCAALR